MWAAPCEKLSPGICGQRRPDQPAHPRSDQGILCPLSELLYTIECNNEKQRPGFDIAHVQNDVNLHSLRMLEDTLSLVGWGCNLGVIVVRVW